MSVWCNMAESRMSVGRNIPSLSSLYVSVLRTLTLGSSLNPDDISAWSEARLLRRMAKLASAPPGVMV
jgi:hypothetical protein